VGRSFEQSSKERTISHNLGPILSNVRGIILDLDGVVHQGATLLPGVREFLEFLRNSERRVIAVTNHSGASSKDRADSLGRMGVLLGQTDIITSGWAVAQYIVSLNPRARFSMLGSAALRAELLSAGLVESRDAEYVVVGYDPGVTFSQFLGATSHVLNGATLIATNPDVVLPTSDGPIPECGALLAVLETVTGKKATIVGKPSPFIIELALNRLNLSRAEVLIVGDTFETDVLAGVSASLRTALVLTGNTKQSSAGHYQATVSVPNLETLQRLLSES
jgi:HAD superfamily hydrolase (TIGR01450 family)